MRSAFNLCFIRDVFLRYVYNGLLCNLCFRKQIVRHNLQKNARSLPRQPRKGQFNNFSLISGLGSSGFTWFFPGQKMVVIVPYYRLRIAAFSERPDRSQDDHGTEESSKFRMHSEIQIKKF